MNINEILNPQKHDDRSRYMLLDRMRMDCDYYLGNGRCYGNHLWAGTVTDQIACMKAIWESFPDDAKPKWLSMKGILTYEKRMLVHKAIKECMTRAAEHLASYPFTEGFHTLSPEALALIEEKCGGLTDAETVFQAITAVVGKNRVPDAAEQEEAQ